VSAVAAEAYDFANPPATSLAVLSASGSLFMISASAPVSLDVRRHPDAPLVQEGGRG